MKVRRGFVSNSSSSSFVVTVGALSTAQRVMICNHVEFSKLLHECDPSIPACRDDDRWSIHCDEHRIEGSTIMDNFSMYEFFDAIGVPTWAVEWGS